MCWITSIRIFSTIWYLIHIISVFFNWIYIICWFFDFTPFFFFIINAIYLISCFFRFSLSGWSSRNSISFYIIISISFNYCSFIIWPLLFYLLFEKFNYFFIHLYSNYSLLQFFQAHKYLIGPNVLKLHIYHILKTFFYIFFFLNLNIENNTLEFLE